MLVEKTPTLRLESYDGPLDLLLDLVRRQELNIFDIPIAQITRQYQDALKQMEELNVEIGGEFILMASSLVHIKSKWLLPRDPDEKEDAAAGDPREDLVQRLLEHEKFKNAAQMLREKQMVESVTWSKPDLETFAGEQGEIVVNLWDLVKAFKYAIENPPQDTTYEVSREEITVAQMMEGIRAALGETDDAVPLEDIVRRRPSRRGLITLFLALLELIRLESIVAVQKELFGDIFLRKHRLFDTVMGGQRQKTGDTE